LDSINNISGAYLEAQGVKQIINDFKKGNLTLALTENWAIIWAEAFFFA